MTERMIGEEAMLASLRDIHLPADASGGMVAEILAAMALGLFLALVLGGLAKLVSRHRLQQKPMPLTARLDALETQPEVEQRRAVLELFKQHAPDRLASLAPSLFDKATAPSTASLIAELRNHA